MAIAFDAASGSTSASYSVTLTGSNLIALVGIYTYSGSVTAVSINGVAMTQIANQPTAPTDGNADLDLWGLLAPTTGTLSITATGLLGSTCASYTDVSQTAIPTIFDAGTTSGNDTRTVTTVAANSWVVTVADGYNNSSAPTASTGVTYRGGDGNTNVTGDSGAPIVIAGNYSTTWAPGFATVQQIAVVIAPVVTATVFQVFPQAQMPDRAYTVRPSGMVGIKGTT